MMSMKVAALIAVAAVVALASSAVVNPPNNYNISENTIDDDKTEVISKTPPDFSNDADDDENSNDDDNEDNLVLNGVRFVYLTEEERKAMKDDADKGLIIDLDLEVATKIVKEREYADSFSLYPGIRKKRWVPVAVRLFTAAARTLFNGAARAPKTTTSGLRTTQQYTRTGSYQDAVGHFQNFRPDNVRTFNRNGISGQTGTVGNHRFTVRNGSSNGSPTLEIRSPARNGQYVRKFRYNQK